MFRSEARRLPSRGGREAGFTLLEVLGAAVIMAFGLLALVNAMNFAYRMQVTALNRSVEWTLIQAKLDELVGLPYKALDPSCNPIQPGTVCNGYTHPSFATLLNEPYPEDDAGYGDWTYTITVTNLDHKGQTGGDGKILRRLDVELSNPNFTDEFILVVVDKENAVP